MRAKLSRIVDAWAASYLVSRGYCASLADAETFLDRLDIRAWWRFMHQTGRS